MKFTKFMTHFKSYVIIAFYNLNSKNKLEQKFAEINKMASCAKILNMHAFMRNRKSTYSDLIF